MTAILFHDSKINLKNIKRCIQIHFSNSSHQSKSTNFILKLLWNKETLHHEEANNQKPTFLLIIISRTLNTGRSVGLR